MGKKEQTTMSLASLPGSMASQLNVYIAGVVSVLASAYYG